MKRLSLFIAAMIIISGAMAESVTQVTVTPTYPRSFTRFIYNYKAVLADFNIKPDISAFVTTEAQNYPAFVVKGRDGHLYAIAAADMTVFAERIAVNIKDSGVNTSYADLQVTDVNEKLNLAAIRLPSDNYAGALAIDSVWFSDQDDNYSKEAQMFLNTIPETATGDEQALVSLYTRLAAISADGGYSYILPNISYKYLYGKSTDQIADGIEKLSDADYETFQTLNTNGDIVGALRMLEGDMAAKNMKKDFELSNANVSEKQTVLEGKNGEYITFAKEFGAWRIVSDQKPVVAKASALSTSIATSSSSSDVSTTATYTSTSVIDKDMVGTLLNFKVMFPYNFNYTGVSGSLGIGYALKYVTFEAVLEYNSIGINWGAEMLEYPKYANFFGIGLRIGTMLPLRVNNTFSIIPNIKFEWNVPYIFSYGANGWINAVSPMAGVDFAWKISNYSRVFVGVQYEHKFFSRYYNTPLLVPNMGYINAQIGFVF